MRSIVNAASAGALVVAASTGVLAGCQGALAPTSTPTSASPSVTPSPTYSVPSEAQQHSPRGAAAFARFYYRQLNASFTGPSAVLLPPLGADSCQACTAYDDFATGLVERGERVEPAPVEIVSLAVRSGATPERVVVELKMRQVAARVVDAKGAVVTTQEPKDYDVAIEVLWQGDRWLLGSVR